MSGRISNVVGFDDAPFERSHRGDVVVVGAVCSGTRLDGVLSGRVRRDGRNSTSRMAELVASSKFRGHVRAVLLQGIAVAGLNVVDLETLSRELGVPVLVVARYRPDLAAMRRAIERTGPGSARKWRLVERAGPMEPLRGVWVQRRGLSLDRAGELMAATTLHGKIPEPLRVAHLIAGGMTTGTSRGRA
ncbi:MAG: DUF99 family protein [Deltaproteobacteria bacterium]|jgi:endonuclease V-like protein UPF0215 family|nr:DUF99 family protein [Deltaproteobacteria bacterium]MBW2533003.1 DUF99 family protein [Deltaproteobacteria bacterium]